MVDKPFEKRIRRNGGSTIGLAGCGIWLFFVLILVGMDERKACKVNTIAFLHPSIRNCFRASCCKVD